MHKCITLLALIDAGWITGSNACHAACKRDAYCARACVHAGPFGAAGGTACLSCRVPAILSSSATAITYTPAAVTAGQTAYALMDNYFNYWDNIAYTNAITTTSAAGVAPAITVELEDAVNDIEVVEFYSMWAAAKARVWLSPTANFTGYGAYMCGELAWVTPDAQMLITCDTSQYNATAMKYVTVTQSVNNTALALIELRVWRGGECLSEFGYPVLRRLTDGLGHDK